jgi:hypothetical protein
METILNEKKERRYGTCTASGKEVHKYRNSKRYNLPIPNASKIEGNDDAQAEDNEGLAEYDVVDAIHVDKGFAH